MKRFWFFRGIGFFFLAAGFVILGGYVIMHLWNWLIPGIFNGAIGWKQAIGILILGRIIFGGFGHRGGWRGGCGGCGGRWGHRGGWGGHHGWGHHDWKQKMENRMANMSPEEREKFKQNLKARWGRCGYWDEEKGGEEEAVGSKQ
jgi:hypothetical protein